AHPLPQRTRTRRRLRLHSHRVPRHAPHRVGLHHGGVRGREGRRRGRCRRRLHLRHLPHLGNLLLCRSFLACPDGQDRCGRQEECRALHTHLSEVRGPSTITAPRGAV